MRNLIERKGAMPLPLRPEAVVFDMDGLLFDTEALHKEAIQAAAKETGHDLRPPLFRRMLGGTWLENRVLLLNHFGDAFPIDDLHAAWMRHFNLMVETRLTLKPGAAELLDTLDVLRLPRAIASHPPSITMCNTTSRPTRLPAALTSSWRKGITRQVSRPRIRSWRPRSAWAFKARVLSGVGGFLQRGSVRVLGRHDNRDGAGPSRTNG